MKYHSLAILACPLALSACMPMPIAGPQYDSFVENPLYAERFYEELTDSMVEYQIQKDPILEDATKSAIIDANRQEALAKAQAARKKQREGMMGFFVEGKSYLRGEVLYVDNAVYFDSLFETKPGPNIHIYLSSVIDPRNGAFTGAEGVDLGRLKSPYGAQDYTVPVQEDGTTFATVILWDASLEEVMGFAQIKKSS